MVSCVTDWNGISVCLSYGWWRIILAAVSAAALPRRRRLQPVFARSERQRDHVTSMFMNGHLISVFSDNDPAYFRSSGKIDLEVEATGAYYTRNIFLKRL